MLRIIYILDAHKSKKKIYITIVSVKFLHFYVGELSEEWRSSRINQWHKGRHGTNRDKKTDEMLR